MAQSYDFKTVNEALNAIDRLAGAFTALNGSPYILSDCQISTNATREDWTECNRQHLTFTDEHPYKRYFAFRDCGCESGSKEYVKDRCKVLGKPFAACVLVIGSTIQVHFKMNDNA